MRSFKPLFIALLFLLTSNIGRSQIVAPDFSVFTTHQDSFHLHEDYLDQGKVVMIEFFFTTCPPCAEISPFMEDLYQNWGGGDQEVEFILITNKSFDETPDVADYADQYGFTFPGVGVDGGALGVWNTYKNSPWGNIFGTPAYIIISPDGSVQYDVSGTTVQSTLDSLNAALARAVNSQPPQPKHFAKMLSTHYHSGDTIQNVFASFIDYPNMGDTSIAPPVNGGNFTNFLPDSIPQDASFSIDMYKNDGEVLEGVSTFDLFFIQRGILGLDELDFYQTVAADINDDGRLSGSDIIALRRVILELEDSFPGRSGWRFFPDYVPANTLDSLQFDRLWEFPEEWHYASEEENNGLLKFKGVKIGDVNHTWSALQVQNKAEQRNIPAAELTYHYNHTAGKYDFYMSGVEGNIKSFQFDLHPSLFQKMIISSDLSPSSFIYHQKNYDGAIRIGFYDAYTKTVSGDRVLFSVDIPYHESLAFTIENSELYDGAEHLKRITVRKRKSSGGMEIYPNPAGELINIYAEKNIVVHLTGFDGKTIRHFNLKEGWNELDISFLGNGNFLIHNPYSDEIVSFFKQ